MTSSISNNIRSADMFLTRGLEKILSDKELKKQSSSQLKKQCDSLLSKYQNLLFFWKIFEKIFFSASWFKERIQK